MKGTVHRPDKFVIVRIVTTDGAQHKVFGTWLGAYLHGESWRMSSRILSHYMDIGTHHVYCESESAYACYQYGTSVWTEAILQGFIVELGNIGIIMTILTEEEGREFLSSLPRTG